MSSALRSTLPSRYLVAAALALACCGCPSSDRKTPLGRPPATAAQLQATYPELASGRFTVLNDFNREGQLAVLSPSKFRIGHGRGATGGGAAIARLPAGTPIAVAPTENDWTNATLCLFSIRVEGPATLNVKVRDDQHQWQSERDLESGWNVVRLDLGEVGADINLRDVRDIALIVDTPTEIALDDLLLTNDRAESRASSPSIPLRTVTRGLRVHSGVAGRFELALQSGLLVSWHGWSDVPLGGTVGVGPWLVPSDEATPPLPPRGPRALAGTQRVLESGFRTVVESQSAQGQRRWTVYSNGAAFLDTTPPDDAPSPASFLLSVASTDTYQVQPGPPLNPEEDPLGFGLLQQEGEDPDLLWIPSTPRGARRVTERYSPGSKDLLVQIADEEAPRLAQMFLIGESDLNAERASAIASGYQHPVRPIVSTGQLRTDADGDLNRDGFNEGQGCYELATRNHRLRLRLEPDGSPLHNPIFRVTGTKDRRCWVYANGRIVTEIGRDADGALLFLLPGVFDGPVRVEVQAVAVGTTGSG